MYTFFHAVTRHGDECDDRGQEMARTCMERHGCTCWTRRVSERAGMRRAKAVLELQSVEVDANQCQLGVDYRHICEASHPIPTDDR